MYTFMYYTYERYAIARTRNVRLARRSSQALTGCESLDCPHPIVKYEQRLHKLPSVPLGSVRAHVRGSRSRRCGERDATSRPSRGWIAKNTHRERAELCTRDSIAPNSSVLRCILRRRSRDTCQRVSQHETGEL